MGWRWRKRKRKKLGRVVLILGILGILGRLLLMVPDMGVAGEFWSIEREKAFFSYLWNCLYPAPVWDGEDGYGQYGRKRDNRGDGGGYSEQIRKLTQAEDDPAYRTAKAAEAFFQEHRYLELYGGEETGELSGEETGDEILLADGAAAENEMKADGAAEEGMNLAAGSKNTDGADTISADGVNKGSVGTGTGDEEIPGSGALAALGKAYPGKLYSLAQLEDYDFLMKHFYNVHTSTTAGRDLMDAKKLLSQDFRLGKGDDAAEPQILIYHTHSQEAFADSQEGETIVAVGEYLAQCLTERGFSVYHDSSEYDVREGELDRNKAYRYALEGVTEILEEHPSIQVVIDLHRDGVGANTHLVTEVNGKPTAQIMFFNGMSQTPEGPIPYLENPYREDNLAFSLQLQLKAAAWYPGFARKIYLKGLRYNQHLRPRSCLVEVGAQTNTYQEVRNAMEPLADIFAMVLEGK